MAKTPSSPISLTMEEQRQRRVSVVSPVSPVSPRLLPRFHPRPIHIPVDQVLMMPNREDVEPFPEEGVDANTKLLRIINLLEPLQRNLDMMEDMVRTQAQLNLVNHLRDFANDLENELPILEQIVERGGGDEGSLGTTKIILDMLWLVMVDAYFIILEARPASRPLPTSRARSPAA